MMPSTALSGYFYALLAATLWSFIGSLARLCFANGMEPLEVAFWRAFLGGLCFLVHAVRHGQVRAKVRDATLFCAFGACCVALFFAVFQFSIQASGAALAVILLYTAPAWVAVFSRILFKERLSARKILSLGVAMGGTLLVCLSGGSLVSGSLSFFGILCGLAAGFTYAMQYPFFVWWKDRYASSTLFTYMFLAAALALLPFLHISFDKPLVVWGSLAGLGILTSYGAYWAYGRGLQRISPVRAAIVSNLEPVLGTFFAWLIWNESFTALGWTGSALVLAAVFLLASEPGGKK